MNHRDHLDLIREGVVPGVWADLGSGGGAFTLALADILGPQARIESVDRDRQSLRRQQAAIERSFPGARVTYHRADFTQELSLPPLDGVLMANSLHFVREKAPVLRLVTGYLKPGGRLVLVEYDSDRGNPWVPHPLSYATWEREAGEAGFLQTRRLARRPSRFLDSMYAALSMRP
jgi:ubiquinone/menaquinone biosynthesis C-methylase UbiE